MKNIAHLVYPFSQDLRTCEQLHGNTEDCRTHPVDAGDGEGLGDTYHTILRAVASLCGKCYIFMLGSPGALLQDLEFGTFLKKAPQRQNLGLWD